MSATNNIVFNFLKIISWIIFVGLCIEAGGLVVNFFFSIYNPSVVPKLYQKLDLGALRAQDNRAFLYVYSFILSISILKAVLFYVVAMLATKIDISRPFSDYAYGKIAQISYCTLSIGLLSYIARQWVRTISFNEQATELNQFWADSQAYILMAAVIYVIATIFKKGLEMQHENDLTV